MKLVNIHNTYLYQNVNFSCKLKNTGKSVTFSWLLKLLYYKPTFFKFLYCALPIIFLHQNRKAILFLTEIECVSSSY